MVAGMTAPRGARERLKGRVRRPTKGVNGSSSAETDEAGFTLIELLVVIVVLGILAGIVVFALTGVSGQSAVAACESDAKTVGAAVDAYEVQNPNTVQVTQSELLTPGLTSLQSWPQSAQNQYSIAIAGDGNAFVGNNDTSGNAISANDVLVQIGASTFDANASITGACASA